MKHVDQIGTMLWNILEILLITLTIFVISVIVFVPKSVQTTIIIWLICLSLAAIINRLWLPIKYYHEN